jgi:predicted Fe-S protein YdhL (DUF1289 family)
MKRHRVAPQRKRRLSYIKRRAKPMVESPCKKLCALNERDICSGCGRTRQEIGGWTSMTDAAREAVNLRARRRLADGQAKPAKIDSQARRA